MQRLCVSTDGHYLVQEDGTPFFWLGDTAWKLARLKPEDVDRYLKDRAGSGCGYTYGRMNLWCMHSTEAYWETDRAELNRVPGVLLQSALDAPGSADLCHLRSLIESKPALSRVPDPGLISLNTRGTEATLSPNLRCATRDEDGSRAFLYGTRGEVIRVRMDRLAAGQAKGFWYNPRNGRWRRTGLEDAVKQTFVFGIQSGPGSPDRYFDPPGEPGDGNDWVLILEIE
jgi:hypothetical protein